MSTRMAFNACLEVVVQTWCRWFLLVVLMSVLCACDDRSSSDPGDLAAPEPEVPLYDDDRPLAGGKTDSLALPAEYEVGEYTPVQSYRVVNSDLSRLDSDQSLAVGTRLLLMRKLTYDATPAYVWVDIDQLTTGLAEAEALDAATEEIEADAGLESPYTKALSMSRDIALDAVPPHESEGAGRFAVTIDMCQSRRDWEEELFDWLRALGKTLENPVPVGIALTGLWAYRHPEDFQKLVQWHRDGELDITWINHSFHHQLSKDSDGSYHFLTAPEIDLTREVTLLEQLLLEHGQVPSVLFRFPGLWHNTERRGEINDLSLFALDANAWIAKGQPITNGAVVLLHGNGNEAHGVTKFFDQVEAIQPALEEGIWVLVPPVESVHQLLNRQE